MRRQLAAAIVGLVLLAGCGSTVQQRGGVAAPGEGLDASASGAAGDGLGGVDGGDTIDGVSGGESGATGSATSGGGGRNSVARGGAATASGTRNQTGPIQLGFLNTKVGNAAAFGLNVGETFPPRQIFEALVKAMNARGGMAGRRIVPVVADTDTASASWESDYQAACARLTQDNDVAAVVGYSFALMESFESCLAKAGVAHLNGGYAVGDVATFERYPHLVATSNVTSDRRFVLQLEAPMKAGVLTKANKLGLLLDDCAPQARAYQRSMAPFIKSNGLNVVATTTMSCAQGAGDVGGVAAQIQNAVLQFRSRGVDTVVTEGVPVVVFAQQAESQGWRPTYLLTSTSGGAALGANVPAAQAANMRGFGWLPAVDVTTGRQPPATAAQQKCLDMLKAEGIVPAQYNDFLSAYTTCDALFLYEAALTATRGAADAPSIVSAITALGAGYQSASTLNGRTGFGARRRDAPAEYRQWGWDNSCSCFVYKGEAAPLR